MPEPTVIVRRVREADWPATKSLRLQALQDYPLGFVTTYEDALAYPDDVWRVRARDSATGAHIATYLAHVEDSLVATATAMGDDETHRTQVVAVYIDPDKRGAGILGALVDHIAAWSRDHGRPTLGLHVNDVNARARRAYAKLGFTLTGETVPHPHDPSLTELEMTRPA